MPPRKQTGRGLASTLKKAATSALKFIKDNKLVSKGARHVGWNNVAKAADAAGYGRRRRRRRRAA